MSVYAEHKGKFCTALTPLIVRARCRSPLAAHRSPLTCIRSLPRLTRGGCLFLLTFCDPQHTLAWQGETSNPDSPNFIRKISAGPLESEDGKYMVGSCFIVEATLEEATAFNQNDPFFHAGVWEKISINPYISIPNGIKPVRVEKDGDDLTTIRMVPE